MLRRVCVCRIGARRNTGFRNDLVPINTGYVVEHVAAHGDRDLAASSDVQRGAHSM
jgi:hypothetical protein